MANKKYSITRADAIKACVAILNGEADFEAVVEQNPDIVEVLNNHLASITRKPAEKQETAASKAKKANLPLVLEYLETCGEPVMARTIFDNTNIPGVLNINKLLPILTYGVECGEIEIVHDGVKSHSNKYRRVYA